MYRQPRLWSTTLPLLRNCTFAPIAVVLCIVMAGRGRGYVRAHTDGTCHGVRRHRGPGFAQFYRTSRIYRGGEWTPVTLRRDRMQRYAVREGWGAVKIHRLLSKIALIPRGGRARVTNIPSRKPTAVPRSRQWFRDADSAGIITHALRKRARPFIFQRRFIVFAP